MTATDLAALARRAKRSAETAERDKAALLEAAVGEALTDRALTEYGYLSAVARQAGISRTYLARLVEDRRPGWLERIKAAQDERRSSRKEAA
ncbi:hypothetical protein GCM10010218_53040 [Streptomyces mashuensis]|uniref:Uncharacterized protein n=1 Tax=Streptomyces mashuensis TaxID=33904 RepID=A0A919B7Z9_9ACTN|nr:hypothetical protein [Streptomyces mashuensis]GHF64977.1 hypothetical protein GCM10010218_53040 [Streptomyces mashuensis]